MLHYVSYVSDPSDLDGTHVLMVMDVSWGFLTPRMLGDSIDLVCVAIPTYGNIPRVESETMTNDSVPFGCLGRFCFGHHKLSSHAFVVGLFHASRWCLSQRPTILNPDFRQHHVRQQRWSVSTLNQLQRSFSEVLYGVSSSVAKLFFSAALSTGLKRPRSHL